MTDLASALCAAMLAMLVAVAPSAVPAKGQDFLTAEQRAADFAGFCDFVGESYAYFDLKATDWARVCAHHAPQAAAATRRSEYVAVLERALAELYDAHAHLGTHTPRSFRLVPSQTDLFARWQDGKAIIAAVRAGSGAEAAGLRPGMEVMALNGESIQAAVQPIEPEFLSRDDASARDWALQVALAGRHDQAVTRLLARVDDGRRLFEFVPHYPEPGSTLSSRAIGGVGHLRIHDALGQQALVQAFDQALAELQDTRALVIDLRDTPSGGNSAVARGIMGRLVTRMLPYQRHELVSEFRENGVRRVWAEYVAPRGTPCLKPLVVLVGRWTGSMGEGLAIGLHATRGAAVLGQPMAQLLGAIGQKVLPHSSIVVRVPVEKLFHVDGTPREAAVPCAVGGAGRDWRAQDTELSAAVALAMRLADTRAAPLLQPGCLGPRPAQAVEAGRAAAMPAPVAAQRRR
ncbi:MAG: S41 family peptidase [Vicinamibacterales bacterium]|jgi:carboxyl-terminal processing protease|nr:S41 family peptidase [Vicinamibacterales bacterium]